MAITLFPTFNRLTLTEDDKANPHKSAYKTYTGIVFDTKKNEFNIVTGKFRDKKDMYEKMTKQDKYLRRAYEARIWDWIQKNAESPVDGYLMLSTAVSKWINNNVLSKYYKKLLHDLPYINREGRKGDPQTMGTNASFESVENDENEILTEARNDDDVIEVLKRAEENGIAHKHVIRVYPVENGKIRWDKKLWTYPDDSIYQETRLLYDQYLYATYPLNASDKTKNKINVRRIFNPLIVYDLYADNMHEDSGVRDYDKLAFTVDDDTRNPENAIIVPKLTLLSFAGYLFKDPNFMSPEIDLNKSTDSVANSNERNKRIAEEIKRLENALQDKSLFDDEREELEAKLRKAKEEFNNSKGTVQRISKVEGSALRLSKDVKDKIRELNAEKVKINSDNTLTVTERDKALAEIDKIIDKIKSNAREDFYKYATASDIVKDLEASADLISYKLIKDSNLTQEEKDALKVKLDSINSKLKYYKRMYYSMTDERRKENFLNKQHRLDKPIDLSNPKFGGNSEGEFISKIGSKATLYKALEKELNRATKTQDTKTADMIKDMLGKEDPRIFSKAEQKAAEQAVEKWQAENQKIKDMNTFDTFALDQDAAELAKQNADKTDKRGLKKIYNLASQYPGLIKTAKELPQTEAAVNDGATALMRTTDDMAIAAQKNAIVEDKTNSELNQDLFDGKELREDVRQALLKIANEFKEKLKLPIQPDDIYFTGSEANYNYNENSDIDVHLVYDFEQVGEMAEILSRYLQSAKRIFNNSHNITIKGLPVEVGAENKAEPLVTSGIYSLISNSWVKEPENANIEIEEPEQPYLDEIKLQIEDAISEKDKDKLEGVIKTVWDIRKEGLANEGEFGPSNTLFKHLRNSGLLTRLKDAYYDVESKDLSLESMLEAEFTNRDNVKVTEDDLINKSEQEIADGLMDRCSDSDEAIAELENTLTTCDDGYKDKIKNTIRKIKESTTFSHVCRKLAEKTVNKLEEYIGKNLPNITPESYVNHLKDIADVEEALQFCYNEIHPNFKYEHPKLAATDKNGKTIGITLDGIEKGEDPKNVLYSELKMVHDPKTGAIYPSYDKNNLMPIEDFKKIIHDPRNKKWYDDIMKGQPEDWGDLIDEIERRARNINDQYRKWCYDNWDRLDLASYPAQYRMKLYDDIVHKGWPEFNAIEKWRGTKKNKFAKDIAIPKNLSFESLDEAKSDNWYLKSQNYDIIKKELDKYVPENILNIPFAVEPKAWRNQKKQNDMNTEPVHYYIVVGMEKGKNPTNFLVREVTYISDDKTWKDVKGKDHARRYDFVMNINDIMREINYSYTDASTLKLNTPEAFEQRALEMMVGGPKSSQKVTRTGTQGHWLRLTQDEVLAVLQIMEEERPRLWKGVTNVYLNSLNRSEGADIVMKALKAFDPNLNSANISSIQGRPEYKIWVPKAQYDAPRKYNNNPFKKLMK